MNMERGILTILRIAFIIAGCVACFIYFYIEYPKYENVFLGAGISFIVAFVILAIISGFIYLIKSLDAESDSKNKTNINCQKND